jgi:hypothetical protein
MAGERKLKARLSAIQPGSEGLRHTSNTVAEVPAGPGTEQLDTERLAAWPASMARIDPTDPSSQFLLSSE